MMLDIFPPYFGFLFLREKRTEKARYICHTRHSTCSHVDLVVLGVGAAGKWPEMEIFGKLLQDPS